MDDFKPQQQPEQQPTDKPEGDFQATFENKPETYVTPAGEPTTLSASPQPSLEIPKKKKSGAKKALLWGVVVLLLAGTGALAYWQWTEAQSASHERASLQAELETVKSASKTAAEVDNDADTPVTVTKTDKELISDTTAAYWHAAKGAEDDKVVSTVEKLELPFARTSVGAVNGGGVSCILKKSDELWIVLFCTQGGPEQSVIDKYGVPDSVIKT